VLHCCYDFDSVFLDLYVKKSQQHNGATPQHLVDNAYIASFIVKIQQVLYMSAASANMFTPKTSCIRSCFSFLSSPSYPFLI
jgi:hypothetical protein